MKKAYYKTDGEDPELLNRIYETELTLQKLDGQLNGSQSKAEVGEKSIDYFGSFVENYKKYNREYLRER